VPAKPYRDPDNYVHVSERVAKELAASEPNGALWANQWDNLANCRAHVEGTGPEIWLQTSGRIDGFTCAIGTGGTLAGISIALKDRNPDIASPIRRARQCTAISRPASWPPKARQSARESVRDG
jgi:cysteine synthase A